MAGKFRNPLLSRSGIALTLTFLFFQNCSKHDSTEDSVSQSRVQSIEQQGNGNGEGYGGKLTYISRSVSDPCPDGQPKSQILVEKDLSAASVVRENCKDITPLAVQSPSLNLMPHNMDNLVYNDVLYDQDRGDFTAHSSLLCRGQANSSSVPGENNSVDAVIHTIYVMNPPRFIGRVILGIYDPLWNLKDVKDMGNVEVAASMSEDKPYHILYQNISGVEHFVLDVFQPLMVADLIYFRPEMSPQGPVPTELRFVQGLHCYAP